MSFGNGHIGIRAGIAAGLLIAVGGGARAEQARSFALTATVPAPGEWQATDHCAVYGPDFTSVAGSDACVRIGGRVRVQFSFHRLQSEDGTDWTTTRSVTIHSDGPPPLPAEDVPDGLEQGHLHVHSVGAVQGADPFR